MKNTENIILKNSNFCLEINNNCVAFSFEFKKE